MTGVRFDGVIKSWNDERGFGFITPTRGDQEIFVHISAFGPGSRRPQVNQRVTFEVELNRDGKKRARDARFAQAGSGGANIERRLRARQRLATLLVLPAFCALFLVVAVIWRVPAWLGLVYVGASVLCFALYAIDKSAAVTGRWRVSEQNLIVLGLLGGWPGALLAQQLLRHKSSKATFRAAFWASVAVNVVAFVAISGLLARASGR
jgi:uncharacterized membrane protein YsdA (DUF1294 family)/cold shock CspA family protein